LFDQQGNPRDKILYDAVQEFANREFGNPINFAGPGQAWAVAKLSEEGDGYEVIGVSRLTMRADCHLFHIKLGEEEIIREDARRARDMLTGRMTGYLQDTAGPGMEVMVHVEESQERFWKGYLRMIGAKPAQRWLVKI
jgi:hypothetical protein